MIETRYDKLVELAKRLQAAERKSLAACERRAAQPPGTTRARATTANAKWAQAAEYRDMCIKLVEEEAAKLGIVHRDPRPDNLGIELTPGEELLHEVAAKLGLDSDAGFTREELLEALTSRLGEDEESGEPGDGPRGTYKVDTPITFYLDMSTVHGAEAKDTRPLSDWTALTAEDLERMTDKQVEDALHEACDNWHGNEIDFGWYVGEGEDE